MTVISLEKVDKFFGSRQVLFGVDFQVSPGEIVGLLGPNGSGKTTTLRLVAGYYQPDAGQVTVRASAAGGAAPRHVGYLPERAPLYDALSVQQYLEFVGQCKGLSGRALAAGIDRSVAAFDLAVVRRTAIGRLSKGFRQRVGLAQAVLGDPSVLLLDEATNGLDPMQIIEARQMIRQVADGRAVIFSSHLMQEVQALCTRVVILRHGHVIADVPLADGEVAADSVVQLLWRGADLPGLCAALAALEGVRVVLPASGGSDDGSDRSADRSSGRSGASSSGRSGESSSGRSGESSSGDAVMIDVRFSHAPADLDALLTCALNFGHVLEARRRTSSVEDLLVDAVRRSDSERAV